jgi:eukaryotic-like serine/threonine-protein kinase
VSLAGALIAARYRLQSRIADGGMGEVWRAMDEVLCRPVAVKLLRREYAGHPETLSRFAAEARHAASVSHPGIAQVYDYGQTNRRRSPYLVMELVDGPSLDRVLAGGPLDPARTMDIVCQVAGGLAAAHGAELVHGDVKPANLLVCRDGTVKITDFGIAHAAGSASITRTGVVIGTAAYLAPEQTMGRAATPASDLYSLGLTAFECLTGTPPFTGTATEVALAHQHSPLPPLPPGVPAEVSALVAELAAKDPTARPASAGRVAARTRQLRDAMTGGNTIGLSSPPGPASVSPGYTQPLTLTALQEPPLPSPRHRLRGGRKRSRNTVIFAASGAVLAAGVGGWLATASSGTPATTSKRQPAAILPTARARQSVPGRTVEVNQAALVGRPVSSVVGQLRQLGLQPQVSWITTARQAPGTVVSVQPAGQIPAGSTVTVTASLQPSSTRTSPGSPVTPAPSASPGNPSSHGKGKGKGGGKDNG